MNRILSAEEVIRTHEPLAQDINLRLCNALDNAYETLNKAVGASRASLNKYEMKLKKTYYSEKFSPKFDENDPDFQYLKKCNYYINVIFA